METIIPTFNEGITMSIKINPFHELYVTERIGPESYIKIFSPYLFKHEHALPLFQQGNIVLKGTKGSGKSMLLRLLHADTRIAYMKMNEEFPVPKELSKFIGAGINLTRCGVTNFGQRPIVEDGYKEEDITPLYFGDYVNYWVFLDLLKAIERLQEEEQCANDIGLTNDISLRDNFAKVISKDQCWLGYLDGAEDWESLKQLIAERIMSYKKFLNFNINSIPEKLRASKTTIGEPLSKVAKALKDTKLLNKSSHVFIKIDQIEVLTGLQGISNNMGVLYRKVLNKALGMRDPHISYRVGSRHYDWRESLSIYGTENIIEEDRDYKVIDIDEILRRKEDRRTWSFPAFAEDIFRKRLEHAKFEIPKKCPDLLKAAFGQVFSHLKMAEKYAGTSRKRVVSIEKEWTDDWKDFLYDLANQNPLAARFAEAWCRQHDKSKKDIMDNIPSVDDLPWDKKSKDYWRKERFGQALMQIAARCGQKMIWSGKDDILSLSGGNILAFLKICQHIWAVWLRDSRRQEDSLKLPQIDPSIQSIGIHGASSSWYNQVIIRETEGNKRQRFIDKLGTFLHRGLYEDKAMSYPGGNGFSLKQSELNDDKYSEIKLLLQEAADYGDLYEFAHTTKSQDKEKRTKWYLHPLLSPHFKIHAERTKEPVYLAISELIKIMKDAGGVLQGEYDLKCAKSMKDYSDNQPDFF